MLQGTCRTQTPVNSRGLGLEDPRNSMLSDVCVFVGVCEHICIASLLACRSHLLSKPRTDERSFAFLAPAMVPPALGPGTPLWCLLAMYTCTGTCTCPERRQNANPCDFTRVRLLRPSKNKASELLRHWKNKASEHKPS